MDFRYPHLSSGYAGHSTPNQTLNAKFYANFDSNCERGLIKPDTEIILFPQRIPRADFFVEIYNLETLDFKISFEKKLTLLKHKLTNLSRIIATTSCDVDVRYYINYANLCLRYGCFQEVTETSYLGTTGMPYALEVALLHEAAAIEYNLSNNIPVSADNYLSLAKQYLTNDSVSDREKVMLLNSLIVTYYRHQNPQETNSLIIEYANQLLKLLEKLVDDTPANQRYCSVGYRGLAMIREFGHTTQERFLQNAESLAALALSDKTCNIVVSLENLYTCTQSMAKWYEYIGEYDKAEYHLNKMIEVDKFDSTGYSELGLFYLNHNKEEKAVNYFKQAMELGPPGAGMNSYFYAKCLETMGKQDMAIEYLLHASRLDDKALSPFLDLFEIYKSKNDGINANTISHIIKNTPDLWEQLEDHEKKSLQSYT